MWKNPLFSDTTTVEIRDYFEDILGLFYSCTDVKNNQRTDARLSFVKET